MTKNLVSLKMPQEMVKKLEAIGKEEERSRSFLIRLAIKEFLKKEK